ncbi:MAG: hypothetical protein HY360_10280 [Verrucomicrobia bacterium]|nr:hypothetical protein [Verrucomicrobiota bacterium]
MILQNQRNHAGFDDVTGNLLELRSGASAPSLIGAMFGWHLSDGVKTSEKPAENEKPFHVEKLTGGDGAVEAVLRSDRIKLIRRFELRERDSLLRARYRIEPNPGVKSLERGVFPRIDFTPDFADAYEDDRDCYSDGAELGNGREMPCWRVFFKQGEETGLILAARSKFQMSHFLIGARSLDCLPHVMINYSTDYELRDEPIHFRGRTRGGYEIAFGIGPWTRSRHAAILRAAKLDQPSRVGNPPPKGRSGPKPMGKIFYAHRFSGSLASARFRKNRWLIARVPWSRQGKKVFWRIDGQCSDYPSKVNTMRYVSARGHGMYHAPSKAYGRLLRKIDLLRTVVEAGKKYGVEIWGWMRFNNYSGNVQSDFFKQHPEFHEKSENGGKIAKLCLAFPEVRKHKIDILAEAAGYGLQGLNLGFLRHAPILHHHPILVEGYRQKYKRDPPFLRDEKDRTCRFQLPPMDEESVRWYRYRAGYLTQFGRELRQRLQEEGMAQVKVSLWRRPNHHLHDGIDLDDWLAEGLCDEVVASARVSSDEHLPIAEPKPEWRRKVQAKVPLLRGIWNFDLEFARRNLKRWFDEGYAGISTYESEMTVLETPFIDFYRRVRRLSR